MQSAGSAQLKWRRPLHALPRFFYSGAIYNYTIAPPALQAKKSTLTEHKLDKIVPKLA